MQIHSAQFGSSFMQRGLWQDDDDKLVGAYRVIAAEQEPDSVSITVHDPGRTAVPGLFGPEETIDRKQNDFPIVLSGEEAKKFSSIDPGNTAEQMKHLANCFPLIMFTHESTISQGNHFGEAGNPTSKPAD